MPEIIEPEFVEPNTSTFTAAQKREYLHALERSIATGVDYVSMDGNQTKFRSLSDMERIADRLSRQLKIGAKKRRQTTYFRRERP